MLDALRRFLAGPWLYIAVIVVFPAGLTVWACLACLGRFDLTDLSWLQTLYLLICPFILFVILAALSAIYLGTLFLLPLSRFAERINGGPFAVGDRVKLLAGRNRGRICVLRSPGQGWCFTVVSDERDGGESLGDYRPDQMVMVEQGNRPAQPGTANAGA